MTSFDLDNPQLPKAVADAAFTSGGFPYDTELKKGVYDDHLRALQIELVKLQSHLLATQGRVLSLFEGRDAAGKGGAIQRYLANLNPRYNRTIALSKPSDKEATQWYFQRYVVHLPAGGETVLFDRSWYNRGVVEPVMGFCTPAQTATFLEDAPQFEAMIVDEGIFFFKFWLNIGREMQLLRFHERRHDPLKQWKISPIDIQAIDKWDAYTAARDTMLAATHTAHAPWTVIRANDKRRARLAVIQSVLLAIDYEGRDLGAIGTRDEAIVMPADRFLALPSA